MDDVKAMEDFQKTIRDGDTIAALLSMFPEHVVSMGIHIYKKLQMTEADFEYESNDDYFDSLASGTIVTIDRS